MSAVDNSDPSNKAAPRWFLIAAIVLLLWSLIGLASFIMHWIMTPGDIAALPQIQQDMMNQMSNRIWISFAIAVFSGIAGALALLARRRIAIWLFAISFAAILIQFSAPVLVDIAINRDPTIMYFPAFIAAMALIQCVLAWRWTKLGWLK